MLGVIEREATGRGRNDGDAAGVEPFEEPLEAVAEPLRQDMELVEDGLRRGAGLRVIRQTTRVPSTRTS